MRATVGFLTHTLAASEADRVLPGVSRVILPDGVSWAGSPAVTVDRVPGEKSRTFVDAQMACIDAWLTAPGVARGARLGAIARYELAAVLAPTMYLPWALARVRELVGRDRVRWVATPSPLVPRSTLRRVDRWARLHVGPIELTAVTDGPRGGGRSPLERARRWAYHNVKARITALAQRQQQPTAIPDGTGAIAFAEYFPDSLRLVRKLATELQARGRRVVWLAGRPSMVDAIADPKAEIVRVFAGPGVPGTRAFREAIGGLTASADAPFAALEVNGAEHLRLVHRPLRRQIERLVATAAGWHVQLAATLDALGPAHVVSSSYSSAMARAASLAARDRGIATTFLQHGAYPGLAAFADVCQDQLLLWGDRLARELRGHGVAASRIAVTGPVHFDDMLRRAKGDSAPGPPAKPRRVVYMAPRSGGSVCSLDLARRLLQTVAEWVGRQPDPAEIELTVKIHPSDRTGLPAEVLAAFPTVRLVTSGSSQELIARSDIVLVTSSTTGYEACAAGKPLIVLLFDDTDDYCGYTTHGAALAAENGDQLAASIAAIVDDPAVQAGLASGRQRLLREELGGGEGDALTRAADAIEAKLAPCRR